ncbi:MAG: shikimate dehydrogenase [bacterium]
MRKIVGIIGHPLGHTISPAMHNAAYKKLGLDYEYIPFDLSPSDLADAIPGLRALHMAGFNVTIPHKEAILSLIDEVTDLAKVIGAVNTVKNQDGRLIGYNTDGPGFIDSLKEDAGFDPKGKNAVVLGAGGASRAVSTVLAENKVKTLFISDVAKEKAANLAEYLADYFGIKCTSGEIDQKIIDQAGLLVNTTPVGMHPNDNASPLPKSISLKKVGLVYDLVYNPLETKLLKDAKAAGCKTCSGLGMLVRQGALAFSIFTGEEPPIEVMWEAARRGK